MAYERVNLDISEVDLKSILNRESNKRVLDELKNPDKEHKTKNDYLLIQ